MAYETFTVLSRIDGAKVGSVEAQSADEAIYRVVVGGALGRTDYMALAGCDRPIASAGLTSYRYAGRYGFVMIGAKDNADALREAARSIDGAPDPAKLEVFSTEHCAYVPVA